MYYAALYNRKAILGAIRRQKRLYADCGGIVLRNTRPASAGLAFQLLLSDVGDERLGEQHGAVFLLVDLQQRY